MESTIADPYGTIVWPVTPHPTPRDLQVFGSPRSYPGGHRGSDYGVATGTPVVAIANGVITQSTSNASEGNFVDVTHDNGLRTHSIHLNSRSVSANQRVTAGQQLGYSGNTGTASQGPHLHIEVFRNGGRIDPHAFFLQYVGPGNDNPTTPEQEEEDDMIRLATVSAPTTQNPYAVNVMVIDHGQHTWWRVPTEEMVGLLRAQGIKEIKETQGPNFIFGYRQIS